jgi:excinuclease ABC subunit B
MESIPVPELKNIIKELENQMLEAAENLEFETAAGLRDQIFELRELLALQVDMKPWEKINLLAGKDF